MLAKNGIIHALIFSAVMKDEHVQVCVEINSSSKVHGRTGVGIQADHSNHSLGSLRSNDPFQLVSVLFSKP